MPKWLRTFGKANLAIAICDRCRMKRALVDLMQDGNIPSLRVCKYGCSDVLDPWRLPARQTERITLRNPRVDVRVDVISHYLTTEDGGFILNAENNDRLTT